MTEGGADDRGGIFRDDKGGGSSRKRGQNEKEKREWVEMIKEIMLAVKIFNRSLILI
jgi:hypothetical protein